MSNIALCVPQDSMIGTVLFFCIQMYAYKYGPLNNMRFADDTTIFASDSGIINVHATMNRE